MKTNFSLLFYLKKPKNYNEGPIPVYLRITVNGKRAETTTSRTCEPTQWNSNAGRLKGTKESVRAFNAYLDTLQAMVYAAHESLTTQKVAITADRLKNLLNGKPEKLYTIIDVFKEHNNQVAALVGSDFAKGTLERYKTSLKHTQDFIKWKYNVNDIDVKEIDHDFVVSYDFYLRSVRKCANNSAVKYLKNFKKIIRICIASGWMVNDPFVNYKAKVKVVDRLFLNDEELRRMAAKVFGTERLGQIRDIFLFSCFTGLAYADVQKLKATEIITGPDGEKWINTQRQKTATPTRVPLLPPAVSILNKYSDSPVCEHSGKALPVSTNQKMNAYLKEIADICGIPKKLTYHIARHTFATTVTLSNGVPIESVSKMLGHTNIKTTQHYAKILDMKVAQDMSKLRQLY
ncbi:site-specific integrase [Mucilaginibacter rubeus]|uniref:Site-specific integrase n=1 Tax=Mucilaginibacter rubeus TaxID=2027860 RepID=A0AAE6JDM3_9SPHI|nr:MULTISPECIES: site-specific integrase [Mucilaginibacter]QEM03789.1 site-specific integrase [Mucilaginibacter rubeus]QEM16401.1 site-specific integrase [Mucilaginibacter gossypii]QTE40832.1 site-specific integrase [Mucilaginibacter rubeus]QTE47435.1 site-specific integrase [Mucilaginibacter rubeus]QTE58828.1 site-specific integrase [Mucilaginibacter rubeus]